MSNKKESQASRLVYEVGYLLDSKLAEDKLPAKVASLRELISQDAGTVIAEGEPKARTLAYMITIRRDGKRADHTKAYFGWIKFEYDPSLIKAIETKLKADKDIIRYLLIKTVEEDTMAHVKELEELAEEGNADEDDEILDDAADSTSEDNLPETETETDSEEDENEE